MLGYLNSAHAIFFKNTQIEIINTVLHMIIEMQYAKKHREIERVSERERERERTPPKKNKMKKINNFKVPQNLGILHYKAILATNLSVKTRGSVTIFFILVAYRLNFKLLLKILCSSFSQNFTGCSCILGNHMSSEVIMSPMATSGPCKSTCQTLLPFLILLVFMTFCVAGTQMPILMVTLRYGKLILKDMIQFTCELFSTVKPEYVVTSIKGSPALSSHIFWVP